MTDSRVVVAYRHAVRRAGTGSWTVGLFALALILLASACSGATAPAADAGSDGPTCLGGGTACFACVNQSCCPEFLACGGDTTCNPLLDCMVTCFQSPTGTIAACDAMCKTQSPSPGASGTSLESCVTQSCAMACP